MKLMSKRGFTFGKNWLFFVDNYFGPKRIEQAKESLTNFFHRKSLKEKSFLDVGCGSGLFSLAAYRLGAAKILSFDIDPGSVSSCRKIWEKEGQPSNWEIKKGSINDNNFVSKLDRFDLVYAWGVLHHTGKMWRAIENTLGLVAPGGYLYLAIYNKASSWAIYPDGRFGTSRFWQGVKRKYAQQPFLIQKLIDYLVVSILVFSYILRLKNPLKEARNHAKKYRGMSWLTDIRDWLGGYPYEFASPDEIFHFIKSRGLSLENLKLNTGLMNNEYLFKKNKKMIMLS